MAEYFSSEDKEKAIAFINFISKKASWDVTTVEAMELNRHLLWFQGAIKKIEDNILEVQKVHAAPEPAKGKSK